ncbi:6-bladed beta-propeller [Echinicola marina]|uniref:6-bladed beta-propeller n=1 Tax=Echinicola marina TaxID=2859768 RepID=UPI001CF6E3AC|nr:6-bladed beta-propeller [Echinicola marina]UCS95066.1 6-bladed beta-propeller [Echinicola marina]
MFFLWRVSLVLAALVVMGCSEEPKNILPTIPVSEKADPALALNEIAKSVKRIQLETTKAALLGYIMKVKQYNEKLYIADRDKVLVFDLEGKFLYQIGSYGEGPGEYMIVNTFAMDPHNGNVYIASNYRILVYSADAELLMEKKFFHYIYGLEFTDGKLYEFYNSHGNEVKEGYVNYSFLHEFSPQLELLDSITLKTVNLKKHIVSVYNYKHFISKTKEGTYLYYPVLVAENIKRDTLYQFKEDRLVPFLKLDFEKPQSSDVLKMRKAVNIYNINNSNSYVICEYVQERENRFFVFNKKDSISYNLKVGPLDDQGEPVVLRPLDLEKDKFYYAKASEFMDKETEESNPIVGIVELK